MAGLVGIVDRNVTPDIRALLGRMCQSIRHYDWYQTELYVENRFGLARVHLGILNPEPQPIFNEDKSLCICMEGEIFDYEDLKKNLIEKGHIFQIHNDPEFILHLYEEHNVDAFPRLNGSFNLAIWHIKDQKLVIATDRYGLRPFYYTFSHGKFLFASEVKAILADGTVKRQINDQAIAEFFCLYHLFDTKTFFEGIELLPASSWLTFHNGSYRIKQYWDYVFHEDSHQRSEEDYVEELRFHLHKAVRRQLKGRVGLLLSGGLDSRMLLVMMLKNNYSPLHTFTWGMPQSVDVKLARLIAEKVGSQHHFLENTPDCLRLKGRRGVWLTEGHLWCTRFQGYDLYPAMREYVPVLFSGSSGDVLLGANLKEDLVGIQDDDLLTKIFYEKRKYTPMSEERQQGFFTREFYEKIKGIPLQSLKKALTRSENKKSEHKCEYYYIRENHRRLAVLGGVLMVSELEHRTPFYDNDLIDFIISVPTELRMGQRIYKKAFCRESPDLARIEWPRYGVPVNPTPMEVFKSNYLRLERYPYIGAAQRKLEYYYYQVFKKSFKQNHRWHPLDTNYPEWFRTDLKDWILVTLLDKNAGYPKYVNRDSVRKMIETHLSRKNDYFTYQIGRVLTFEMWYRLFIDDELSDI